MAESRMVAVNGVHFEVCEDGPANAAETVVFLHGTNSSARIWSEIQRHLAAAGIRSVAINSRGAGGTEHTPAPEDYRPSHYAADAKAVLEAIGVRQFTLVAHALGTRAAARYLTEQNAGEAVGFAYMSGAHMLQPVAGVPLDAPTRGGGLEDFEAWKLTHHALPPEVQRALYDDIAANPPQRALGQRLESQPDHVAMLAKLELPILHITGDADGPRVGLTLRAFLAQPEQWRSLHVIHGNVGHYPNAQAPEEIARVLVTFVHGRVAAGATPIAAH